jgi:hypothetical protein
MAQTNHFAWAPKAGGGQLSWAAKSVTDRGGAGMDEGQNANGNSNPYDYNHAVPQGQGTSSGASPQYTSSGQNKQPPPWLQQPVQQSSAQQYHPPSERPSADMNSNQNMAAHAPQHPGAAGQLPPWMQHPAPQSSVQQYRPQEPAQYNSAPSVAPPQMQYHQQGIAAPQSQHAQNPPPYQNEQGFNHHHHQQQQQQQQPSPGWMDASASQHANGMMYPGSVGASAAPNNQYQQQQTPSLAPPPNFNTGADMPSYSMQGLSQYNGSAYGAYGAQQPHANTSELKNWGVDEPSGWGVARTHWEQQPADFTQPSAPLPPVTVAECPFCFKDTEHLSPPLDCGTTTYNSV